MVLATIIRLEMAYPGVGILAGDSLQYLTVVTAHAVIMVFFMIMPLVFGAFGNFLLPTQLGVHDVAFPRLNSAAFWFLPGGLIMLCQLVCLDRRYQRMNCFNIREVESLLKGKFFPDLVNSQDHRTLLNNSMVGLRFKTNNLDTIAHDTLLFNTYALGTKVNTRYTYFNPTVIENLNSYEFYSSTNWYYRLANYYTTFSSLSLTNPLNSSFFSFSTYSYTKESLTTRLSTLLLTPMFVHTNLFSPINSLETFSFNSSFNTEPKTFNSSPSALVFSGNQFQTSTLTDNTLNSQSEGTFFFRYQRALNPVFKYDYKLGNYFTKEDSTMTPFMFTTAIDVTGGIRKSSWFFSSKFVELFNNNVQNYVSSYSGHSTAEANLDNPYTQNTFGFYNFLYNLQDELTLINYRWIALSSMDQKFHKMYLTSSMQQRIFANWRQLKFTREAWRCKLLTARHQKTLYHRYANEDGIFWAVERNAKDVLPGWAMITPFSSRVRFTAIGKVDIGLMGVFLVLNSSIVSSANFLVTYRYLSTLNNRKMRDARSFFTEGVMVASWMMIAANPMLIIGILMLLADRHWQTSFFDYSGGGDTVLFQHMFWFFGHPEVYVIMIPAFGFNNTILSFYLRKRVSARASLLYSMYTIAFLGFFVWGHHMYMVGLAHTTRMLFSTLTVMISVPAATKLMHWCVTLVNSSFAMELPFVFALLFIFFFVSGGISGMAVAHTGMDILFHDTFYVVGHFHVMFAGSAMFANFGAFYFYFPSIFGVKFSRIWGYLHCIYFLMGQLLTVIPMIWLGYSGMPRRVLDYPASLGGWHAIISAGHLLSVAGLMAFFIMIFDSLRQARAATRNTFGISRFNTRLNFYLYEVARTKYIQRKGWYLSRFNTSRRLKLTKFRYSNNEHLETTLFSYSFVKKSM
jgi:heme/copper-type cytochrome/quinol oxidase subunit 1